MIKEFVAGKKYRYTGKKRLPDWHNQGGMDYVLDGKPRMVLYSYGKHNARFKKNEQAWNWKDGFENWEKVVESIIAEEGSY